MPFPRIFAPIGTIIDLVGIWAHFTFTDPPQPVECYRCLKSFVDGNGVTRDLATSLNATIFCRRCYVPYVEYLDALEDSPDSSGERIPIELFVKERDAKNPRAEEDKQQSRNDPSSTLVIVSPMVTKPPNIPSDSHKEAPKAARGGSPTKRRAIAPFPHIAGGMRSIAQLGTFVATDTPLEPRAERRDDAGSLPPTLHATSSPSSPSITERAQSNYLYLGASIVRAGGLGTHLAIRPTSEPAGGSTPRPESPSLSVISEITLADPASNG